MVKSLDTTRGSTGSPTIHFVRWRHGGKGGIPKMSLNLYPSLYICVYLWLILFLFKLFSSVPSCASVVGEQFDKLTDHTSTGSVTTCQTMTKKLHNYINLNNIFFIRLFKKKSSVVHCLIPVVHSTPSCIIILRLFK